MDFRFFKNGFPIFKHRTVETIEETGNQWVYLFYSLPKKDWVVGKNHLEKYGWAQTVADYIPGTFFLLNYEIVVFTKTK